MQLFVINLDADTARFRAAETQLKRAGLPFCRFPAVDGGALPPAVRAAAVNPFRWWCAMGRPAEPGEVGCALSHRRVYERMVAEAIPVACVLEDDVVLAADFPGQLQLAAHFPDLTRPQVVLLSNHSREEGPAGTVQPSRGDTCAEGYVLTLPAARNLLRVNTPLQRPYDHWRRWVQRGVIELYHAFPAVCSQNHADFHSHVDVSPLTRALRDSLLFRIRHKVKRLIGLTLDRLLP